MNSTQKRFYRYKLEQKLPEVIRHNLTPVTIHQVINSKVEQGKRFASIPTRYTNNFRLIDKYRVGLIIQFAVANRRISLLRVFAKRYKERLQAELSDSRLDDSHYIVKTFKGWNLNAKG